MKNYLCFRWRIHRKLISLLFQVSRVCNRCLSCPIFTILVPFLFSYYLVTVFSHHLFLPPVWGTRRKMNPFPQSKKMKRRVFIPICKVFTKLANQPNKMALIPITIWLPVLFSVDERQETAEFSKWQRSFHRSAPNGKRGAFWKKCTVTERIFRQSTVPFDFQPKFPDVLIKIVSAPVPPRKMLSHALRGCFSER